MNRKTCEIFSLAPIGGEGWGEGAIQSASGSWRGGKAFFDIHAVTRIRLGAPASGPAQCVRRDAEHGARDARAPKTPITVSVLFQGQEHVFYRACSTFRVGCSMFRSLLAVTCVSRCKLVYTHLGSLKLGKKWHPPASADFGAWSADWSCAFRQYSITPPLHFLAESSLSQAFQKSSRNDATHLHSTINTQITTIPVKPSQAIIMRQSSLARSGVQRVRMHRCTLPAMIAIAKGRSRLAILPSPKQIVFQ
jgi:hypothetical protein